MCTRPSQSICECCICKTKGRAVVIACSCNKKNSQTWTVTKPDGTTQSGLSQIEAAALARRTGGSYALSRG